MLQAMGVGRLDPSVWNLGVPLVLLAACGPVVTGGSGSAGDSGGDSGTSEGDSQSGSATSPSTTATSMTTTATSASTGATTSPVECHGPQDCPPGYDCIDGLCDYQACAEFGAEFGCNYDCYTAYECDAGSLCQYGGCVPVEAELGCEPVPFGFTIPIPVEGATALAFIDLGAADRGLLVGGQGTRLVRLDGSVTTIDEDGVPTDLAVRDIDGDGDQDIAMVTGDGRTRLLVQQGPWLPSELGAMRLANLVEIADTEADGFPDVFAGSGVTDTVAFRNEGPGGWLDGQVVRQQLVSLARGSLDGDAFEDVLLQTGQLVVLAGGDLEHPVEVATPPLISLRQLAVADFDQSGDDDVVMLDPVNGTTFVTVMRSPVLAGAEAATSWWPGGVYALDVGDLDGDGDPDLVGADGSAMLTIGWGGDEPGVDLFTCVSTMATEFAISRLAVGDFSGDGRNDIAVTDGTAVQVLVRTD